MKDVTCSPVWVLQQQGMDTECYRNDTQRKLIRKGEESQTSGCRNVHLVQPQGLRDVTSFRVRFAAEAGELLRTTAHPACDPPCERSSFGRSGQRILLGKVPLEVRPDGSSSGSVPVLVRAL